MANRPRHASERGATIPRLLHQIWLAEPVSLMCTCSRMSWQRYADVHGFTYSLWDRRGIEELPLTPLARRLWHAPPWAKGQHGLLQTSLAKYELMRLFGGLYVDCDLLWLGATIPPASRHEPTERLLHEMARASVLLSPEPMGRAENLTSLGPIRTSNRYGTAQVGRPKDGMSSLYLNTAILAAPAGDPLFCRLLDELDSLELSLHAAPSRIVDEWRVTGPEAMNRLVASSLSPLVLLPQRWLYPHPNDEFPPPRMSAVSGFALTWGELKPWIRDRLFAYTPAAVQSEIARLGNLSALQLASGRRQCVWDGRAFALHTM